MTNRIYFSVVEFIKERPFEIYVPAFYHPHMPRNIIDPPKFKRQRPTRFGMTPVYARGATPLHQVADPNQMQLASYSIEVMLDMFQKKIEFELKHEVDVVEILDGLDRYLLSIRPDIELGDEASTKYAELVIRWREEVYKHYYRYMQTHPTAKEKLYPNESVTGNFLHLLNLTAGVRDDKRARELDPLLAKSKPPFEIKDLQAKPDMESKSGSFSMESSLGLGVADVLADDGDFNFNDFLGGRS